MRSSLPLRQAVLWMMVCVIGRYEECSVGDVVGHLKELNDTPKERRKTVTGYDMQGKMVKGFYSNHFGKFLQGMETL